MAVDSLLFERSPIGVKIESYQLLLHHRLAEHFKDLIFEMARRDNPANCLKSATFVQLGSGSFNFDGLDGRSAVRRLVGHEARQRHGGQRTGIHDGVLPYWRELGESTGQGE
jgi:hypothetical protein